MKQLHHIHKIFLTVLVLLFSSMGRAQTPDAAPWLAGYRYRVPVTVENKTEANLPGSPVLLRFDSMSQILLGHLRRDGGDLRVTDAAGNEVPRVIEGLQDDASPARIWVRSTPLATGAKADYFIYYGNPVATVPADGALQVFSGQAQFEGGAVLSEAFEDLATEATTVADTKVLSPRGVAGYHGRGAWFNGQNAGMTLKVPEPALLAGGFTVSLWMKMLPHTVVSPSALVDIDGVFLIRENEVILATPESRPVIGFKTPINEWLHVAATYDGGKLRVFTNGKEVGAQEVKGTPQFTRGNVSLAYDPGSGFHSPVVLDDLGVWAKVLSNFPDGHAFATATIGTEEINAQVPAPPDPGVYPVYIPLEAEDFEGVVDDRWRSKSYQTLDVGGKTQWFVGHDREYLSRAYGIFTLTPGATATKTVEVPADGNYQLWVRYAPVGEHEYARGQYTGSVFEVKAEQNGQTVAKHDFGKTLDYDTRMARWESTPVALKKGSAKLTLSKNIPSNTAEKIDLFVLTNDANYVPDVRHYGMVWLRFKILDVKGPGPYRAELRTLLHNDPWSRYADLRSTTAKDPSYFLTTGADTGWLDGLQWIKGTSDATFTLSLLDINRKSPEWGKVQLEYARLPRESAIFKRAVSESTRAYGFTVMGPLGDLELTDAWSNSVEAISREHLAQANAQDWPKDNTPKTITLSAATSIEHFSDETVRNELTTLRRMGNNFLSSGYDAFGGRAQVDIAKELGIDRTIFVYHLNNIPGKFRVENSPYGDALWNLIQGEVDQKVKWLRDRSGEDEIKRIHRVPLNDEVESWLGVEGLLAQPESLVAFKKWLDEQKITPASVGIKSWDELKVVKTRNDAKTPEQKRLWMHEMDFLTYTTTLVYKRTGQIVEKALGHAVDTTLNPSPHQYMHRGWASELDGLNYLKFWQDGGARMPWGEDWNYDDGMLYITAESSSYITELTRAGASQTHPTGMYVTSGGAKSRRQKVIGAIGRGAKHVNHYTYGPRFANTEGSWSFYPEIFREIGFINADIAKADDLLGPARQRKGQVALLYSWSSDVWRRNPAGVAERLYEYLAMVHGQMPVDILSEEQVAAGGLAGYKTLYVVDDNVRRPAVQQIAKWLNGGGTLVAMLGAGTRDEFDADSNSFDTLLGLNKRNVQVTDDGSKFDFHRSGIGQTTPVGEISVNAPLGSGKLPVYSMKAVADVKGAKVLGTWADGSPAATMNASGQGQAIWIGAYPGLSYARGSNVGAALTTEYPAGVRAIMLSPTKLSGVKRDVELDVPVVEATLQESDKGAVITLNNYTLKPIAQLSVTARTSKPVKRVESVQQKKELPFTKTADGIALKMPLELTDFVKLYY